MKRQVTGQGSSMMKTVGIGTVIVAAVSTAAALLVSALVLGERVSETATPVMGHAVRFLAVLAGVLLAVRSGAEKRWIAALLIGAVYLFLLVCINILLEFQGFDSVLISVLTVAGGVMIGGLLKGKSKNRKHRYMPHS